jgi:2-oxoglutarate ferredoxin oxidoreductase subunit alpha
MQDKKSKLVLVDASRILIEATVQAGASVFIGYPITPANWLYAYASQRFPTFLPAPDEISSLQWAAGFATAGKIPATATSFPGFALMIEPLNMAFMMELPVVIILAQRMGPSTGSATAGAQGDLLLMRGCISGGYPLPVFCPSNFIDCWDLASQSVAAAVKLRTPVILLTSKEMVMTTRSLDLSQLSPITLNKWIFYEDDKTYKSYQADRQMIPPFLPVGNSRHQVKINASTHDPDGFIRKATPEAIANTLRLQEKIEQRISEFTFYEYDQRDKAEIIIATYGITSDAARDAVTMLRKKGLEVSLLILKTVLPVPPVILDILHKYEKVIIAEENAPGLLRQLLYGQKSDSRIRSVNKIAYMITPSEIIQEVEACQKT